MTSTNVFTLVFACTGNRENNNKIASNIELYFSNDFVFINSDTKIVLNIQITHNQVKIDERQKTEEDSYRQGK
jgi:hypothetical protein